MSREWKPGDVALVEAGCWANHKVALRLAEGWAHVNGVNVDGDGVVSPVRPLVVIDLPDGPAPRDKSGRTEARLLIDMLRETADNFFTPDAAELARKVADQIEAQTAPPTPPRIAEPGMWGVVEASCVHDDKRRVWTRFPSGNWHTEVTFAGESSIENPDDWDSLIDPALVREGVTS